MSRFNPQSVVKWVARGSRGGRRTLEEGRARWGHYLDDLMDKGVIITGEPYAAVRNGYRWLIVPILVNPHPPKPEGFL